MQPLHDSKNARRAPRTSLGVVSARLTRIIERLANAPAGVSAAHFAADGGGASALRKLALAARDTEAGLERTRGAQRNLARLRGCIEQLRSTEAAAQPASIAAALLEIESCAETARTALARGAHRLRQGCDALDDLVEDWTLPPRVRALRATVGRRVDSDGLLGQAALESAEASASARRASSTNSGWTHDGNPRHAD